MTAETLHEWKTPRQLAGLRICDPACGSGSFLLAAYKRLLDYHRDWYLADGPEKHRRRLYQGAGGLWYLATEEKKRILLGCIFGVDIDPQAVEVTKLNLLLCVLENENQSTVRQLALIHQCALPDLGGNIKCGNSLIGTDFYNGRQLDLFDEETQYRINAFDWRAEFAEAFKGPDPGFDAIIGNPPYVRIQTIQASQPGTIPYLRTHYECVEKGNFDIYVVFVDRGIHLLNRRGKLGYILPAKFFTTDYGAGLRGLLAGSQVLSGIVDFAHEQVFEGVTTYTCLLFLDRSRPSTFHYMKSSPNRLAASPICARDIDAKTLGSGPWIFLDDDMRHLAAKLVAQSVALLDLPAIMSRGSSSGADDVFCLVEEGGGVAHQKW